MTGRQHEWDSSDLVVGGWLEWFLFIAVAIALSVLSISCTPGGPSASLGSGRTLASTAPAQQQTAERSNALDPEEWKFLDLINAYRAQNGAPPLQVSATLQESSRWLSEDMANRGYFEHTDSQGRDPFVRMSDFGYTYSTEMGENIAAGNAGADETFQQWKSSPGHNQNMLNPNYRVIGIARYDLESSPYGWYWTTDFGGYVDETVQ